MFTWTNKARGAALIWLLAGCQMELGGFAAPGQTKAISVLGGAMTVAAPSGYCVDKRSARSQADGAVVLMGRCNGGSNHPAAVISVTIGEAGSAGIVADGGTVTYENNMIALGYDNENFSIAKSYTIMGICDMQGENKYYYNSINIGGVVTSGTNSSYAMYAISNNSKIFKNNIFLFLKF